jgi:hypothetical protein
MNRYQEHSNSTFPLVLVNDDIESQHTETSAFTIVTSQLLRNEGHSDSDGYIRNLLDVAYSPNTPSSAVQADFIDAVHFFHSQDNLISTRVQYFHDHKRLLRTFEGRTYDVRNFHHLSNLVSGMGGNSSILVPVLILDVEGIIKVIYKYDDEVQIHFKKQFPHRMCALCETCPISHISVYIEQMDVARHR